ncbi:MAG: hypothetical protein HC802_17655 [Caldilineaceae bacterium]|nr:hypothetical protein [Caldilineaceae bacterium]
MPELPEVETYVRGLAPALHGRQVLSAQVHWPATIAYPSAAEFSHRMADQVFIGATRRGKYMVSL